MNEQVEKTLKPLASLDGAAAFDEPWQAEALAIADTLVQNGMFSAGAWSEALGEALRKSGASGASDDQQTYYQCVLAALENLIAQHSEIDRAAMAAKRGDWEQAYLSTPHGQPVKLDAIEDH
ncbi:MAG TPA: nitrile hydratase accessory protein [Gammaproteobacteria bacterium]|nr:nitrile hydratase accessory protein [Gammaproteobacteria bacterium]